MSNEEFDDDLSPEDELCCEYGVTEFCPDPEIKDMGLCTTECASYMKLVEEEVECAEEEKDD